MAGGAHTWPAFAPDASDNDERLQFDAAFEVVMDFRKAECDVLAAAVRRGVRAPRRPCSVAFGVSRIRPVGRASFVRGVGSVGSGGARGVAFSIGLRARLLTRGRDGRITG